MTLANDLLEQLDTISEKTVTVSDAVAKQIAQYTDDNEHTTARVYISQQVLTKIDRGMGKRFLTIYQAIADIQNAERYLPSGINTYSYEKDKEMKQALEQYLSPEDFQTVWDGL